MECYFNFTINIFSHLQLLDHRFKHTHTRSGATQKFLVVLAAFIKMVFYTLALL